MPTFFQNTVEITFYEVFSFLGLIQSVFILVYIASRSWRSSRSIIPFLYFLLLGGLFYIEFAAGFLGLPIANIEFYTTFFWLLLSIFSYLLIIQIINLESLPRLPHYLVVFMGGCAFLISYSIGRMSGECDGLLSSCDFFQDSMVITFTIAAAISLSVLFFDPMGFRSIRAQKDKRERYWLALTIILVNACLIALALAVYADMMPEEEARSMRIMMGMAFVYLATTSLFRIYPPSIPIVKVAAPETLSKSEQGIIADIERLMAYDKLYQEPSFSRADLARELNISEGVITRVINAYYGKSFPVIVNEKRVEEAKHLLIETDANIKTIAVDVGFNSIASFNRVFKDYTGMTASDFRGRNKA